MGFGCAWKCWVWDWRAHWFWVLRGLLLFFITIRSCSQKQIWCQTKEEAMAASSRPRLSGMQKQVLSLYRGFLRAARAKSAEDRQQIESLVSSEFCRSDFIYSYLLVEPNLV
ncbi:hypothetical protein ACE6H2_018976 [Prunus campanulata]